MNTLASEPGPAYAAVLAESDRRDTELAVQLAWIRWTARAEWRAGYRAGYLAHAAAQARSWHMIADPVAYGGPSFADLERRRWGPGGRQHFSDPRPGDFPGRGAA